MLLIQPDLQYRPEPNYCWRLTNIPKQPAETKLFEIQDIGFDFPGKDRWMFGYGVIGGRFFLAKPNVGAKELAVAESCVDLVVDG